MKLREILFLLPLFLFVLTACSDDITLSPTPGEPPEIQELTTNEVDVDYYNEADTNFRREYRPFNTARNYVTTASSVLNSGFIQAGLYYGMTSSSDPEFEDDWWVWINEFEDEDGEIIIRTRARERNNSVEWQVYLTGTAYNQDLENYLFLEGVSSKDGTGGEWTLYNPNGSTWNYTWTQTSQTEYEINYVLINADNDRDFNINYRIENELNFMTISGTDFESDAVIFWNADTGAGYIEQDGDRRCWDDNYEQTSCENDDD